MDNANTVHQRFFLLSGQKLLTMATEELKKTSKGIFPPVLQEPNRTTCTLSFWQQFRLLRFANPCIRIPFIHFPILKLIFFCQCPHVRSSGDILRISQVDLDSRYPKYHKFSNRSDYADMLEISQVLKRIRNLWYIAANKFHLSCDTL